MRHIESAVLMMDTYLLGRESKKIYSHILLY